MDLRGAFVSVCVRLPLSLGKLSSSRIVTWWKDIALFVKFLTKTFSLGVPKQIRALDRLLHSLTASKQVLVLALV